MKKKWMAALMMAGILPVAAQTNFRHITYEEAVAAAKAENKLLFLDFYTDWCGPCKMMMNNVFPQKEVGDYFNAKFVCLKVNAEKEGKELAAKHAIKAYPTFIVLDADEKVMGTKVGGNYDGKAFISDIDRLTDPEKTPERLKQRYESGERTAGLISAYAGLLNDEAHESRRPDKAKLEQLDTMIDSYFNSLTEAQRLAVENVFLYTSYTKDVADPKARFMIDNRDRFDASVKKDILEHIKQLYTAQIYDYMEGKEQDEAYQALKQGIADIGEEDAYAMLFRIIEKHAEGDLSAFCDFCEKEYPAMDAMAQRMLVQHLDKLVRTDDEAVRMRASRFLRSHLAEMEINMLYSAVMQIGTLENPKQ